MGAHSTQHRVTFIITTGIQNMVSTISEGLSMFRRVFLLMTWPNEGLRDLKLAASLGAIHDSAERYPAPNCHLDTRKAVRQIILDWIRSESSDSFFFWLYGPAGAGRTAILQAIAEFLCSPSGSGQNFGGSFFFPEGSKGVITAIFCFQRSHINSLWRYLGYANTSIILWNYIQHSIQSQWTYNYELSLSMRSNVYRPFHNVPIFLS